MIGCHPRLCPEYVMVQGCVNASSDAYQLCAGKTGAVCSNRCTSHWKERARPFFLSMQGHEVKPPARPAQPPQEEQPPAYHPAIQLPVGNSALTYHASMDGRDGAVEEHRHAPLQQGVSDPGAAPGSSMGELQTSETLPRPGKCCSKVLGIWRERVRRGWKEEEWVRKGEDQTPQGQTLTFCFTYHVDEGGYCWRLGLHTSECSGPLGWDLVGQIVFIARLCLLCYKTLYKQGLC